MTALSYVCLDCGSEDTVACEDGFEVFHEPTCPVLVNGKLSFLAEQEFLEAAALDGAYSHLVADYGSAEVRHLAKRAA